VVNVFLKKFGYLKKSDLLCGVVINIGQRILIIIHKKLPSNRWKSLNKSLWH